MLTAQVVLTSGMWKYHPIFSENCHVNVGSQADYAHHILLYIVHLHPHV